jgi:adenylate kinase
MINKLQPAHSPLFAKIKHFSVHFNSSHPRVRKDCVRLTIIGPPGSGKGTQTAKIQRDFGLSAISTGQMLRTVAEQETELGIAIRKTLAAGDLVSDSIMLTLIQEAIMKEKNVLPYGWILDGYPRTPTQAEQLEHLLNRIEQPLSLVLYLNVPEEVLLSRIQERWVHLPSGRTYNTTFSPPKVPGIDDITGEPLVKRIDDNPEAMRARIRKFHEATLPLLDYYRHTGLLIPVDSPTSDIGYIKIKEILDAHIK